MKKPLIITIITAITLALIGGGVFWYLNKYQVSSINHNEESENQSLETNVQSNGGIEKIEEVDTSGWQTYRNEELGFEIEIPGYINVDIEHNDEYNRLVVFKGGDEYFEVRLKDGNYYNSSDPIPLNKYFYLDLPIFTWSTLGGREAVIFKAPNGYCDGPGCGHPFITYAAKYNNSFYNLSFFNDINLTNTEKKILSTFKFIK